MKRGEQITAVSSDQLIRVLLEIELFLFLIYNIVWKEMEIPWYCYIPSLLFFIAIDIRTIRIIRGKIMPRRDKFPPFILAFECFFLFSIYLFRDEDLCVIVLDVMLVAITIGYYIFAIWCSNHPIDESDEEETE